MGRVEGTDELYSRGCRCRFPTISDRDYLGKSIKGPALVVWGSSLLDTGFSVTSTLGNGYAVNLSGIGILSPYIGPPYIGRGIRSVASTKVAARKYRNKKRFKHSFTNVSLATFYLCGMGGEENLHTANVRHDQRENLLLSRQGIPTDLVILPYKKATMQ